MQKPWGFCYTLAMKIFTPKSSPRDFFLYFLAIITLYISVWRYIDLLFEYINFLFPDQLDFYFEGMYHSVRWSIASLVIVFPFYLGITWYLRKDAIANPEKREIRVRKWLLNLTLFLAAVTIIVDLVTLVNRFLEGDLTARFVLKVLAVLITAGAVFAYYFWDLRRETLPSSKPSKWLAGLAALVVLVSIGSGFFIIGSPMKARKLRFDERRVNDLSMLQGEIINLWQQKRALPKTMNELNDDIRGFAPPTDPETNAPYEYKVLSSRSFELCATFNLETPKQQKGSRAPYSLHGQNFLHGSGRTCFTRTVDPDLYPPYQPFTKPVRIVD